MQKLRRGESEVNRTEQPSLPAYRRPALRACSQQRLVDSPSPNYRDIRRVKYRHGFAAEASHLHGKVRFRGIDDPHVEDVQSRSLSETSTTVPSHNDSLRLLLDGELGDCEPLGYIFLFGYGTDAECVRRLDETNLKTSPSVLMQMDGSRDTKGVRCVATSTLSQHV